MSNVVIYKDRGWAEIASRASRAGSTRIRVGVIGPKAEEVHPLRNNITVGEVALINEFGSERAGVPRRSFIASTFREGRRVLERLIRDAARRVVRDGVEARVALDAAGREMAHRVRRTLIAGVPPPNAPATVKEKGHDLTLLDTETLLNAITNDVVTGPTEGDVGAELNLAFPDMGSGPRARDGAPEAADAEAGGAPRRDGSASSAAGGGGGGGAGDAAGLVGLDALDDGGVAGIGGGDDKERR